MLMHDVERYLAGRRAVGYDLVDREGFLRSFAGFAAARRESRVRTDSAVAWARLGSSPAQCERRLAEVIRFARHVHAEDARHEIPPRGLFGHHAPRQRPPCLWSPAELRRLLDAASHLTPPGSLRPRTYVALFSLLAATGLRVSEALALRLGDLGPEGLTIRRTKFRKSRLVPLHDTAVAGLERYLVHRRRVGGSDDHLLVSERGRPLCYNTVSSVFQRLRRKVAPGPGPGGLLPRIHDLRHGFAVRALETCPRGRQSVGRHMLALSTYLGHVHVADTYWYLHVTPQLLADIAEASEAFVRGDAR